MPGVSANIIVDTGQLPSRTRAAIIKQIRRGVFSKSPLGILSKRLIAGVHGVAKIEGPCIRWYGPILVRKEYMEEQADQGYAGCNAGNGAAARRDDMPPWKMVRSGSEHAHTQYVDFMYYHGLNSVINMLSFESSERWRAISAPVLAAIERKEVITCTLSAKRQERRAWRGHMACTQGRRNCSNHLA